MSDNTMQNNDVNPEPNESVTAVNEQSTQEILADIQAAAASDETDSLDDLNNYLDAPFSYDFNSQEHVVLNTGAFNYTVTDLVLPGKNGLDLVIQRRYDSSEASDEKFSSTPFIDYYHTRVSNRTHYPYPDINIGLGWNFVMPGIRSGNVTKNPLNLYMGDGRTFKVSSTIKNNKSDNNLQTVNRMDLRLYRYESDSSLYPSGPSGSKSVLCYKDGKYDYFDTEHLLLTMDRFGNTIRYQYESNSLIITDSYNRVLTLSWDQYGNFNWSGLPNGKQIKYVRSGGLLQSCTDQENQTTTYGYTPHTIKCRYYPTYPDLDREKSIDYMTLTSVEHPSGARTEYVYNSSTMYVNGKKGYIDWLTLKERKDIETGETRNLVSYSFSGDDYGTGTSNEQIGTATRTQKYPDGISTNWISKFNRKNLCTSEETRYNNVRKFYKSIEEYDTYKLPRIQKYTSPVSKTVTTVYDEMANLKSEKIELGTGYDIIETTYEYHTSYNYLTKKKYKKDNDALIEEYYEPRSNGLDVEWARICENGTTKQLTRYYYDGNEIREERGYYGNLDARDRYVHKRYTYGSYSPKPKIIQSGLSIFADSPYEQTPVTEEFAYDWYGRETHKKNGNGQTTETVYDNIGRVKEEKYPGGAKKTYDYMINTSENYIIVTDENTNKRKYVYTPLGKIREEYDHNTGVCLKRFEYDSFSRLQAAVTFLANNPSKEKRRTKYEYDYLDRVTSKLILDVQDNNVELYRETCDYNDTAMTETKMVDGGNNPNAPSVTTTISKDKLDRVKREVTGNAATEYGYDYLGNKIWTLTDFDRDDTARKLEYSGKWTYDHAGRVLWEYSARKIGAAERYTKTSYDKLGNKETFTDFAGNVSNYTYNALGRLTKQELPFEGNIKAVTQYVYDGAGNVTWEKVKRGDNDWREKEYRYDGRNRLTDIFQYKYAARNTFLKTKFVYDDVGNKKEVHTGLTENASDLAAVTKYDYDQFGNMKEMLDPRSNLLSTIDPLYRAEKYEYDVMGRLSAKTDRNKHRTVYQYDAMDRIKEERVTVSNPTGSVETVRSYSYTKTGQKASDTQQETGKSTLSITYRYNNMGRLTGQTDPGGIEKTNEYDPNGNRTRSLIKRGSETVIDLYYGYDTLNRLETVTKDGSEIARYTYYPSGNRETLTYPNSVAVAYTYNDANLVKTLANKRSGANRSYFSYEYFPDGNQRSKTGTINQNPSVTTTYVYDKIGRLTEESESGGDKIEYLYDRFSNREKMIVTNNQSKQVITVYTYNRNNWLKKEESTNDKITDTFYYRYDANGNQCSRQWERVAPAGTASEKRLGFTSATFHNDVVALDLREYNGFNQLISVNRDHARTYYSYRSDGLRNSKTVDGIVTTHYWDSQDLIAEYGVNGFKARYLRGINLIAQQIGAQSFYYLHNAHGDVVQRVGADGNAAPVYEYDAFGNQKNFIETDPNPFRYCGELYDAETESYYLRARYMEPRTGRFTAEDSVRGAAYKLPNEQETVDPLSLNLYTYANSNPILYIDSTGNIPQWAANTLKIAAGVAIVAGFAALTVATFGGAVAVAAVATGAIVGSVAGAGINIYGQYKRNNNSFDNFNLDEAVISGVQGGLSGVLATIPTPLKLGGIGPDITKGLLTQAIGNAAIAGGGSLLKGNDTSQSMLDAVIGGLGGLAGGSGVGLGQNIFNKHIVSELLIGMGKATLASNGLEVIINYAKDFFTTMYDKYSADYNRALHQFLASNGYRN